MIELKMKYTSVLLLLLLSVSLKAQQKGLNALQDLYQDVLHPSDILLNGREYIYYFSPQNSTPLIPKDSEPSASVLIRKKLVQNVVLMYDTYKDLVVYYNPYNPYNDKVSTIILNSHTIEEFTLLLPSGKARFRYLTFPEDQGATLGSGFYEIVSEGACTFIINHHAIKNTRDGVVMYHYKTEGYILSSGAIYKIKGKKSLLRALSDQHTEVSSYLQRAKIEVKRADKEQIKAVLDYYTGLKNL